MKRFAAIIFALLVTVLAPAQSALDLRLEEYFAALENCSTEEKKAEADFIIGSCGTDSVRNHVALKVYDHYLNSKLMGDEAVAIHVTDNWFSTGKAKMTNELDLMNARIFADFNRSSLIGMKAPAITLQTPDGAYGDALGGDGEYAGECPLLRVLLFYDTSCANCMAECILLRSMFRQKDYQIEFIAVNTGSDMKEWTDFMSHNLDFNLPEGRMRHYWDPSYDSGYEMKYGVMQTPRMYLIGTDGTILGRNLDTQALMSLLAFYDVHRELEYGGEESMSLFGRLLPDDGSISLKDVRETAGMISERTLEQASDTLGFRQLAADMLYYLVGKRGAAFSYGAAYVSDSLILSRPDIWRSPDDSMKVVSLARMVHEMMLKAPEGSRLPSMKVPGTLRSRKGDSKGIWSLTSPGKNGYILFHTEGCHECMAEIAACADMVKQSRSKVLLVNVDALMEDDPQLAGQLFDAFDLSSLPFVLKIGKGRRVEGKYLTFVEKQN